MTMSMTSCATIRASEGCEWVAPINISELERKTLSDQTKRQILSHNLAWERFCD